jgi:tetratricopeptide (TPR) repeat protein
MTRFASHRLCVHAAGVAILVAGVATRSFAQSPSDGGTLEGREQARLCERLDEEEGIAACRAALALGLDPERVGPVREMLARHLADLERWSELAEHYRGDVRLAPDDPEPWRRLGSILLFALNERVEALAAFEEASRLDPGDALTACLLGIALHSLDRFEEATEAFDRAVRLDPTVLDGRPAACRVREAARLGQRWP